jgi:hypothetical protein
MHRAIQIALVVIAAMVPSIAGAVDSATMAKRANILSPQTRGEAFRSMDSAYPYHLIKRGDAVSVLPRQLHKLDVTYTYKGKRHTLDDLLERSRAQGFLVIKDGKIVDERYFNGADEKSKFTSWSVGKSFTSTLVGLALSDGQTKSLNDPITTYLPESQRVWL